MVHCGDMPCGPRFDKMILIEKGLVQCGDKAVWAKIRLNEFDEK